MPLSTNPLKIERLLAGTVAALGLVGLGFAVPAFATGATIIGSYDNFDCFNDTGQTAEGFEIDVEDVSESDLTREFPSNFPSEIYLIRYGLPTVTSYDWTHGAADADHSFDNGHKGVLITWAASYQGGKWVAPQGSYNNAGNGTPYNPNPTLTAGDSCWWWGLGAAYPASGCEHFGVSFASGVVPGRISYHWKVPSLVTPGLLANNATEAAIPPSPTLSVVPPAAPNLPPVVKAVAQAPIDVGGDPNVLQENEPQFGDAYWLKTTTFYSAQDAVLKDLQVHILNGLAVKKVVTWTLLQKPPGGGGGGGGGGGEREDAEDDGFPDNNAVQVTKQYQYFKYSGAYDSETHEVACDAFYGSQAAALNSGTTVQTGCQNPGGSDYPYVRTYWTINPGSDAVVKVTGGDLGTYLGAHVEAYNVK